MDLRAFCISDGNSQISTSHKDTSTRAAEAKHLRWLMAPIETVRGERQRESWLVIGQLAPMLMQVILFHAAKDKTRPNSCVVKRSLNLRCDRLRSASVGALQTPSDVYLPAARHYPIRYDTTLLPTFRLATSAAVARTRQAPVRMRGVVARVASASDLTYNRAF